MLDDEESEISSDITPNVDDYQVPSDVSNLPLDLVFFRSPIFEIQTLYSGLSSFLNPTNLGNTSPSQVPGPRVLTRA